VLATELHVKFILKLAQCSVLVAWDGHGRGPVVSRVDFDLMLEQVVIEIICCALPDLVYSDDVGC
jgi:hypothetical protein